MGQTADGTAAIQARLEKMKSMKLDMTYKLDQEKLQSEAKLKQHRLEMDRQFNQQTRTESDALARAKQEEADAAAPRKPVPVPQTGGLGKTSIPSGGFGVNAEFNMGESINSQAPQPASKDTATTTSEATNDPRFRNETTTTTRTGQENRGMIRNMLSDAIGGPFSRETTSTSVSQQLVEVPNWAKGKGKEVLDLHNIYQDQPEVFAEHMAKIEGVVGPEAFKAIVEEYEQQLTNQTATRKENVNNRAQILVDTTTINGEQLPFSQAEEVEKLRYSDPKAYAEARDQLSDISAEKDLAGMKSAKFEMEERKFSLKEAKAASNLAEVARAQQLEINDDFEAWRKTREPITSLFSPAEADSLLNFIAKDKGVIIPGSPRTGADHKALSEMMADLGDDAASSKVTVDSAGKVKSVEAVNPEKRDLLYKLRLIRDDIWTYTEESKPPIEATGLAGIQQKLGWVAEPQIQRFKEIPVSTNDMRHFGNAFNKSFKMDKAVRDAAIARAVKLGVVVEVGPDKYSMPHIEDPGNPDNRMSIRAAAYWESNIDPQAQLAAQLDALEEAAKKDRLENENPDIPREPQSEESGRDAARWIKQNAAQTVPKVKELTVGIVQDLVIEPGKYLSAFADELGREGKLEQEESFRALDAASLIRNQRSLEAGRQGIGTDKVPPKMRKFLDDRSERINKTNAEKRRKLERALHGN